MPTFELGRASVSRAHGEALHAQLAEAMRLRIRSGEWPPGHRLPPEPALAEEIGVSRGTLRRGLAVLVAEGLVRQVPGRGTFVADPTTLPVATLRLTTLAEDIAGQGEELSTVVVSAGLVPAPTAAAEELRLAEGERVFAIERIRSAGGRPLARLRNFVVPALAPGIERVDFAVETLFGVLEGRYGLAIDGARRRFSAVNADAATAEALDLEPGRALQFLEQVTLLDDGRPVEYSEVWLDSDRLRIVTHLSRHAAGGDAPID